MLYFECDYNNGCHPEVLKRLVDTNDVFTPGYGFDEFSESAREKIKEACGTPDANIYFLAGGTQTNAVVIDTMTAKYQGAIATVTGHIATHESGAIELTGHKVLTIPEHDGKMCAADLKEFLDTYYAADNYDHMVFPGLVYISWPTEYGTLYSKKEMQELHALCKEYNMPLFVDGARMIYGLASKECDMTLADIAANCDAFYIGGTKCGTLIGEALIFPRGNEPLHEFSMIKQHGALLSKGRNVAVQFEALFTNDLYKRIGENAIGTAEELKSILKRKGYPFFLETSTNQQFVIAENSKLEKLGENVRYSYWEKYDDTHTVIRFCTSWATTYENLKELEAML